MTSLCQIPGVGNVCTAATAPVGAAAGAVTDGVLGAIRTAVINACVWAVVRVISGLGASSRVSVTSAAVATNYRFMVAVAVVCMLPLIGLAAISALLRADPGALARAVFGALPAAALLTLVGIQLTQTFVDVVDAVTADLLTRHVGDGATIAHAIPAALGGTPVPVVIGVTIAMAAMCAALAVWIELLVRAAAVEVAVIFLPLVFAGIVWPATARYARRLAEILAALILSKLVIVGIVSLGMAELTGATVPGVLAGTAMLGLAAFAPFVLLSLIPMAVDAGQLSQSRRGAASVRTVSRDVGAAESTLRSLRAPAAPTRPRPRVIGAISASTRGSGGRTPPRPRIMRGRR